MIDMTDVNYLEIYNSLTKVNVMADVHENPVPIILYQTQKEWFK